MGHQTVTRNHSHSLAPHPQLWVILPLVPVFFGRFLQGERFDVTMGTSSPILGLNFL